MTQHFEMVQFASMGKENRLATLKNYLDTEEKSANRSQSYIDDLKDSIQRLKGNKRFTSEDNKKALKRGITSIS